MRLLFLTTALLSLGAFAAPVERTWVPQLADIWELSRGLSDQPVPLPATTVLLCQVSVPSLRYDSFAGADLRVSLNVNGVALGFTNGPQDSDVALLSFPVTLARGDRVTLTVWDRDVTENELVGSGSVTLGSELPVAFTKSAFAATCRGVPEAMTVERQLRTLGRVDAALEVLSSLPSVRLTEQNFGRPDRELTELDDALDSAGAWQAWKVLALEERVRRAQAIEARWTRAVTDEIAAQLERLPKAGAPVVLQSGVVEVTVGALRCVHGTCSLALELQNLSDEPLEGRNSEIPAEAFDRAQLLSTTGLALDLDAPAKPVARPQGKRPTQPSPTVIAPGARVTVKLTTRWDSGNAVPRLLRLRTPFGWKVLRLREP